MSTARRLSDEPFFIIVMGVSGSGKTTIGRLLAERLAVPFYEGDDYHPPANVAKMAAGIPLDDDDRAGWLRTLANLISERLKQNRSGVIACSALKKAYRDQLRGNKQPVRFVYLKGDFTDIQARIYGREGHFMKATLLPSQFDTLEEPRQAITVNSALEPNRIVNTILEQLMDKKYDVGMMGMGVMGRSLSLNLERHGYQVISYDPFPKLPADFPIELADSVAALVAVLATPRIVLMMVPAGAPVDTAIASLKDYLQAGDIIIDGGNSYFTHTARRAQELAAQGIHFVGMGVSGGESGALWGPSLMPGGARDAGERVMPMLKAIAAVADDGAPCVTWIGPGGAGHYVKMVHNGIEYGDMELIAEIYDLLHRGAGLSNDEVAGIFERWNEGELRSYLIEITAKVLRKADEETGRPTVDMIMDIAGQKGTGRWTSQIALEVGSPIPTINAAVVMRLLSAMKDTRAAVARRLGGVADYHGDVAHLVRATEDALYAAKITTYAQGMDLLRMASAQFGWDLDIASVVRIWRAGCIIRAELLDDIAAAFEHQPDLPNLYLNETIAEALGRRQSGWREVIQTGTGLGVPLLALAAALGYFDAIRSEYLPANLIQAQRDFFGAHTYHRIDREGIFHTDWEA
ncbi:MAG: NADP-dependent phosphogluconate dehydrogenase [Candidatus Promineofilum sp.]|nr:NADP-dependent phosphogluconate dehydrogenase [Promineifilum sp.]